MRQRGHVTGLVAMLWVAGCAHVPTGPESQPAPVTSPAAAVPAPSAAAAPFRSAAEDPKDGPCIKTTHGCIALNPDVDEATIDVTNLLAEGYRPFLSADGRTLYLAQSPRTIRAGLSFSF